MSKVTAILLALLTLVIGLGLGACGSPAPAQAETKTPNEQIADHVHYIEKEMNGRVYGCFVYSDGYRGGIDCNFVTGAIR
jgi:hypothetical protein